MLPDLKDITLRRGDHKRRGKSSVCMMEAVAWFAGEMHSAYPTCVSPVIGAFLRTWNDALDDETRQWLKPYIPRVIGTAASPDVEERRAWLATDWLIRVHAPAWLVRAGLVRHATALRALAPVVSAKVAIRNESVLAAARAAAVAAVGNAIGTTAWNAAVAAAGDAVEAAVVAAAGAAVVAAARDAVGNAIGTAAWNAAVAAAWNAAVAVTGDAIGAAASDAARAAAEAALQPTVVALQASAFGLLDRMIDAA